jgi:hypothetical protein
MAGASSGQVFLWVDLGIGGPSPAALAEAAEGSGGSGGGGGEGGEGLQSRFPFGDDALNKTAADGARLNDFTSLCTAETRAARTHATNWNNPLLILPEPARVRAGERLRVRTRAAADTPRPSYLFEVTRLRAESEGGGATPLAPLEVGFDDIYPDYGGGNGETDDSDGSDW